MQFCGRPINSAGLRSFLVLLSICLIFYGCSLFSRTEPPEEFGDANDYIGNLFWPIPGGKITSTFGWRFASFHFGLDISAPKGTPIHATHDGLVLYSGRKFSGYGNLVVVRGSKGIWTFYAHNSQNLVQREDAVKQGQIIAEVGATGHASGPHVHYEIRVRRKNGKYVAVDPMLFYPIRSASSL